MRATRWLKWALVVAACAGFMDATTGVLLMIEPRTALALMLVPAPAETAWVFVRFVGAFVFAVGSLYLGGLLAWIPWGDARPLHAVLATTTWIRAVICAFTAAAVLTRALPWQWASVPAADGCLAAIQVAILIGWRRDDAGG